MFPCGVQPPNLHREVSKNRKAEEWASACHGVLTLMQDTLAVLYDGVERDEENPTVEGNGDVPQGQTLLEMANRFTQQCAKLSSMLSMPSYGQVRLPVTAIIKVISRCLKVSYTDVKSIPSMSELIEILPGIHQAALQSLYQLILCCRTELLPQSLTIIDLCLQALASAQQMDNVKKWEKRAKTYRVLYLLIETCGWGQYLTRQSKIILQEIMSDIKCQNSSKQTSETGGQNTKDSLPEPSRKKRKKKRNKVESYSELTAAGGTDESKTGEILIENVEATVQALKLARLTLESVEFSTAENLMRCVLDTAAMLQREGPALNSQYIENRCRQALYSGVFACITVKLRPASNRKDTVTHFQLTNLALSLLTNGQHIDFSHEVKMICKQALTVYRLTGNLNRPIVRRLLPKEDNDMRDVMELEREVEKVNEENEQLRERLLQSEMENQTQSRLISSLRQEIENLKSAATKHIPVSTESPAVVSQTTDVQEVEPPMDSDDSEVKEVGEERHQTGGLQQCQTGPELSQNKTDDIHSTKQASDERLSTSASPCPKLRQPRKKKLLRGSEHEDTAKRKKTEAENQSATTSDQQQSLPLSDKIGSSQPKESPVPSCSKNADSENSDESDGVQAMISDFVDAGPDLM